MYLRCQIWRNNWVELSSSSDYPLEIRKIVYTTNVIESLNRGIKVH
ncbi:MAG: transposase [Bacteroidales bacterium]|nr:transposase [Bacteroidales bacterium]